MAEPADLPTLDVLAWVCIRERRVLAVRTRGRDAWYLPGGKREPGEDDSDGICREVREELGVELLPESLRPCVAVTDVSHGLAKVMQVRMTCYFGEARGGLAPQAEIESMRWLTAADGAQCAPAARQVLAKLLADGLID